MTRVRSAWNAANIHACFCAGGRRRGRRAGGTLNAKFNFADGGQILVHLVSIGGTEFILKAVRVLQDEIEHACLIALAERLGSGTFAGITVGKKAVEDGLRVAVLGHRGCFISP